MCVGLYKPTEVRVESPVEEEIEGQTTVDEQLATVS